MTKLGILKSKKQEILSAIALLDRLQDKKLSSKVKGKKNIALEIATKIYKKFPVIYASNKLSSIATRWRGQIAENSKTLSSTHVFPEMNHNEIVGWVNPRNLLNNCVAIILRDKSDHSRIKRRMDITASILKKERFKVITLEGSGKNLLDRMLTLIYIGDFASFYLSILNGIDPTPVKRITYLKGQLTR